ncbi:putative allantoate permease [Cadophora sp. MPI-SDFR-AT-0126]|nr:putative allantoate permease [Leotiomycetes sp. MPI-SDFR-AT-0126]
MDTIKSNQVQGNNYLDKSKTDVSVSQPIEIDGIGPIVQDWTEEEERRVKRKIDFILIPVLGLAFFALQLDRGNISSALTSTLTKDLGINTNQVNVGSQLLSAGIVLLEIPSNIILQKAWPSSQNKVGPRPWLSVQILAWGLVATFQAFITNYASYLTTRLLLGLLEAGFIPGALYYLSTWYKKGETSLRVTFFFFGQMFANATSQLIAAGLLSLEGKRGLSGWQWLFLIDGLITIFIAFLFILFVPPSAGDGNALITFGKFNYFTERESHIITNRVLLDDPQKARGKIRISRHDLLSVFKQPRVWVHVFITMLPMAAVQGLGTYTPSIIKNLGFGTVKANALSSVGIYCAIVFVAILSYFCDLTGQRGPFALISSTWAVITYSCLRTAPITSSKWHRYGLITLANVSYASVHVLNLGWISVNCTTPQERSICMALVVMAANCAGIAGSQIFRTEDAPKYIRGLTTIIGLAAGGWVLIVLQMVGYWLKSRKLENSGAKSVGSEREGERDVEKV